MTEYGDEPRESMSAVMRDGLVMNPHDAAIIDKAKCETSGEHLAEPGDLHCQRCGEELSIEDGARINEKYWETDEHDTSVTRAQVEKYLGSVNEQRTEAQRHGWSAVTKEYAERMQEGSWQGFDPEPIKVDPNATLFGSELRYDTTPLLPRLLFSRITATREQLGLPPVEPDTFAVVELPEGWWGLRNVRTDTVVLKIHGPGAKEDITDRWNAKTAGWLAWRKRQDG
jgi:hypothetical protein